MHIGIDASRLAVAARTGTEHYSYELLAGLAQIDRIDRFTLYCNRRPAALPPLGPNFALRAIPFLRLWTHARLSAELALRPPNVLFVPAHVLPLGAPLRRTRTVVTIHDMGYLHFPEAHTPMHRRYLALSTLWSARAATHVIAISGATRDDLVRHAGIAPAKISVIHHGLSARFRPADEPAITAARARYGIARPYFLYVGTLQPRKNLVRLIEAFARLESGDLVTSPQLVIAGKRGWLTEAIERRAAELGVAERVALVEADAGKYPLEHGAYDIVSCIGATWIGDGLAGTLALMRPGLRDRDSLLLVGEPFWLADAPDEAYEQIVGGDREAYLSLAGTLDRIEAAGFELVEMVLADHHGWDRYNAMQWRAVSDYLRAHPEDPEAAELRAWIDRARREYLAYGRRYFGWGVFVLRVP